ncbi:MAG: glycosyltransferase family 2 protein [Phycisphaerales bacterium]|nr:glycosyltransferase family 2 protein [Phycisphaerales bacterium]
MTVWIALPAYNEGPRIGALLDRWSSVMGDMNQPHRYVIVDDGSTDDTPRILAEFAKSQPADITTHPRNLGLGPTLRDALFAVANRAHPDDLIVTMDADNTHPPELLPDMLDVMNRTNCDVVIASRFREGARVDGVSPFRRLTAGGAGLLFRLLLPVRGVRDYTCGYRLCRVSTLCRAMALGGDRFCARPGFECTADVLLSLAAAGATFAEVPLHLSYSAKAGASRMPVAKTIRATLNLVISHRFRR